LAGRSARKSFEGFGTGRRTRAGHLEYTELADRAEAVLHRANDAVGVMLVALEVQDRVDDMLEHLGSGEASVLRDVARPESSEGSSLGREQKIRRRLPHLTDAARRRLQLQRKHGLNRVHDQERGLEAIDLFQQPLDARLGEQIQRRVRNAQPLSAHLDLMLGLLAGAVQHRPHSARQNAPQPAAAAWTSRCPVRRPGARAIPARCRRRGRDRIH
jgi:hypothetical protein